MPDNSDTAMETGQAEGIFPISQCGVNTVSGGRTYILFTLSEASLK
ncbi:MAG: hypothetical protein L3J24_06960 [Xanthomonadales bacterium]|nr:hypothetical protein [Xanthomonadales bacterium]